MAEVYAGFLSHTDHEIGRLLDFLEESGELDNTIVVLGLRQRRQRRGRAERLGQREQVLQRHPRHDRGEPASTSTCSARPATYNHYPVGWAWAFNTPFKMWKRYNFEGGVADPMIVSWPKGIKAKGELRHQFLHATDIVPTIYDCLGVELPEVVKGYTAEPARGRELPVHVRRATTRRRRRRRGFFSMLGSRAIWHKGWKAVSVHPTIAGWGHFDRGPLGALRHRARTRPRSHDLAARVPGEAAGDDQPLVPRRRACTTACRCSTRPRSRSSPIRPGRRSRRRATGTSTTRTPPRCPSRRRSTSATAATSIAVEVDVETPEAAGVLFSHGARFGGHALYVKDGKLKYVYNFVGDQRADGRVDEGDPDRQGRSSRRVVRARGRRACRPPAR